MHGRNILSSWKEIASYLGRAERTCRRWEKELDLPIYRMDGSPRSSVFAYKEELDRWLDELLHQKKISPRKPFFLFQRKFIIILSLSITLVSILAVIAWKISSPKPGGPALSGKPSLAIFYFRNKTGDESLDDWRKALCGLLIGDLAQSRYLNVLPEDRLFYILQNLKLLDAEYYDAKDLAKFAEYSQVDNIVIGNVAKEGNKLRIDATLIKMLSGESVDIESLDCTSQAEIFSLVDEISKRVKAELVVPPDMIVGDIDKEIENITTSSIEAYGYYGKGRQLFRRGQVSESASLLEKAVEIDPDFAAAYRMMAMCYAFLPGDEEKAKDCMERAYALRHHVSERERLQIQAQYSSSQGEMGWDEAIKALKELLHTYPDDYLAICDLGNLYRQIEDFDSSIETLQKIVHVYYINDHFAWLRRAFCARGNYDDALKLAKSIPVDLWPAQYPYQLTLNLFLLGKLDLALYEADKILARSEDWYPALRLKGDIYLAKEEWTLAEDCYNKCLKARDLEITRLNHRNIALARLASLNLFAGRFDKATSYIQRGIREVSDLGERRWLDFFHLHSAYIYYKKGDIEEAAEECQNALDAALDNASVRARVSALRYKGLVALDKGNLEEARMAAVEIKRVVDGWLNPKLMRYYHHLVGHIELERQQMAEAIAYFEKAVALLPCQFDPEGDEHALFYESLAFALYRAQDYERARKWYEEILDLTSGKIDYGDIYVKSFFMLGKIYEQKGWRGKAIESYQKFLGLWKDADPGISEVEDAEQRLISLQN